MGTQPGKAGLQARQQHQQLLHANKRVSSCLNKINSRQRTLCSAVLGLPAPGSKSGVAAYLHPLVIVLTREATALYGSLKESCVLTVAVCCCSALAASSSAGHVLQAQGSGTKSSTAVLWAIAVRLCKTCSQECTIFGQQHALLIAADSVGL